MSDLDTLLAERERYWLEHPIITESAVLPTRPVKDACARTKKIARKSRASMAMWAPPLTGKSSCIRALRREIAKSFPGSGVLLLEAVEDKQQAEGRLLISILKTINYAPKISRDLAEKRDQVRRALIAFSGKPRHLFIFIDEAQEVTNQEFAWLKAVINGVSEAGVKVTTIIFGQVELCDRRVDLKSNGRSDLCDRFMKELFQFRGFRVKEDLRVICRSIDEESDFPEGSGWTFTRLLFPRAYESGFRFLNLSETIWEGFLNLTPPVVRKKGIPMDVIATFFANLCVACKDLDDSNFVIDKKTIEQAIREAVGG